MVAPGAFADDPLRVLRLARVAVELDLEPDEDTLLSARAHADRLTRCSAERLFAELRRIISARAALRGLELMASVGATAVVLPELDALRGVEQSRFHHSDVYGHTLEVLERTITLANASVGEAPDPGGALGEYGPQVAELLAQPLADELTRGDALRWGALLHDAAKPLTRAVRADGRVTFIGHDSRGAELAREVLGRLRASERLSAHVAALVRHHLRLGFLVHEPQPLSRRTVYGYLRACTPVEGDVTLLSVADRLATRGDRAQESIDAHLGSPAGCSRTRCAGAPTAGRRRWCAATSWRPRSASRLARGWVSCSRSSPRRSTRATLLRARRRSRTRASAWSAASNPNRLPRMADPDCIFCKIVAGELPATIIDEDERTISFMDIAPATRGHALVIPRAHSADLLSVDEQDLRAVAVASKRLAERVKERLGADGVNLVNSCGAVAWQTVFHFHVHVIPRYEGDPLRLPWVPAPGDPTEIAAAAQELARK